MMLTEEEARERRCCGPQNCGDTRGSQRVEASATTPVMNSPLRYCITSACMAWRFGMLTTIESGPPPWKVTPLGYCGIAGTQVQS